MSEPLPAHWCDTCKKDTHDTTDCWGLGTVAIPHPPQPYYRVFVRGFKSPYRKPKGQP